MIIIWNLSGTWMSCDYVFGCDILVVVMSMVVFVGVYEFSYIFWGWFINCDKDDDFIITIK